MRRGNYTNPCLTMHQPWASLLVYGIKRIEGRSWPSPIRGRLWIHAASKIPDEATIKAMEEFYREIYAVDGITDIQFPQHYPVSRLIGCVEVVGCVTCDELQNWEALPEGVRLEGQTNFCWLCENPQKLIIPFEMRGYQGVYNLENKIYAAAARGLTPTQNNPFAVKFPLPDTKDPFSLKPGSVSCTLKEKKEQVTSLTAAIAGARAAATQFSKKGPSLGTNSVGDHITRSKSKATEEDAEQLVHGINGTFGTRSKSKGVEEDAESLENPVHGSGGTSGNTYRSRSKTKGVEEDAESLAKPVHGSGGTSDSTYTRKSKNNNSREMGEEGCSGGEEDDKKLTVSYNVETNPKSLVTKREERDKSVGVRRFDPGTARIMAAAIRNLKPSS